jgi:hypothetical protein
VLRTSDEAAGSPVAHGDLHDFLVAVGDPTAPEAHATFTFDTVADFLAAFTDTGEDLLLGGGDGGELPHTYLAGELSLTPAIPLPRAGDRVEIALGVSSFAQDNEAVVYLRAAGTLG